MEAKDICAKEIARQAEFGYEPSWEDFVIAGQEEGIREVVKWIQEANNFFVHIQRGERHYCTNCDTSLEIGIRTEEWQAQKKVWFNEKV